MKQHPACVESVPISDLYELMDADTPETLEIPWQGKVAANTGIPGTAIKLPTTVFDVLLPQIFAVLPIRKEELRNLADGGLCRMCRSCHWPNCTFGRY